MYCVQDYAHRLGDLSAFLERRTVARRGPGFRENCELITAYARVMRNMAILDKMPRLGRLDAGGISAIDFESEADPSYPSSEEGSERGEYEATQ